MKKIRTIIIIILTVLVTIKIRMYPKENIKVVREREARRFNLSIKKI